MSSRKHDAVLRFALGLPGAWEDHPWGDLVVKVGKKIFVFLGADGMAVKLTDSHDHAMSLDEAKPTAYGLGKAGWVDVPLGAADADVLRDWVEESYRNIATKKLIAQLDERSAG
jgi:predicted DNA-binding protein (MmcQ/YjbR family)